MRPLATPSLLRSNCPISYLAIYNPITWVREIEPTTRLLDIQEVTDMDNSLLVKNLEII